MPVAIAQFSPDYEDGVVGLIVPIQQEEFGVRITAEDQPDLRDIPGFYQRDRGNFWIALEGDRVVGTVALLDIGAGQAALRKMFVDARFRGSEHGTARLLLAALLDWARAHQIREIYLGTTSLFLAAHRFYEKNGFAEIPKADLPPTFPVMAVDSKFYRLTLPGIVTL